MAGFVARTQAVPLLKAAGDLRPSWSYPTGRLSPRGHPVLAPGEAVTLDKLAFLFAAMRQGVHVCGTADPTLRTPRVVDRVASETDAP